MGITMKTCAIIVSLLQLNLPASAESAVHWHLPSADNATSVPQGYIGFGIEMRSFPDFAGVDTPNNFTKYMLHQLSNRTNAPVHLRIGGTSGDNSNYNASLNISSQNTGSPDCKLHINNTLGKPWLANTFGNLDPDFTRYTFQVPLARLNEPNGIEFANACINAMPSKTKQLDAIEIGNEPNLYPSWPLQTCGSTDRPRKYGALDYSKEWRQYAGRLVDRIRALNQNNRKDWFQGLSISSGYKTDEWDFDQTFWNALNEGGYVRAVSQHYYQVSSDGNKTDYPPDHINTVNIMETKFRHNLDFVRNHKPKTAFVLGEVGTVISDSNSHSNQNLFNTLGSALWTLDFLLYGMSMGVDRVSTQMASSFPISAWHFVDKKAVHANFYGMAAAADFIGPESNLQIKNLTTDGHENIAGYAGFNGGKLSKVAILNMNRWNTTQSPHGPETTIYLTGLGDDVKQVTISKLTATNGATDKEIHWAGKRWTAENEGKEYNDGPEPVKMAVQNGAPIGNITVRASEAILLEILRN